MALKHDGRKPIRIEPGIWKFPASHDCKAWWYTYDHHPDGSTCSYCTCPSYHYKSLHGVYECKHVLEMWRLEREIRIKEGTEPAEPQPVRRTGLGAITELERIFSDR